MTIEEFVVNAIINGWQTDNSDTPHTKLFFGDQVIVKDIEIQSSMKPSGRIAIIKWIGCNNKACSGQIETQFNLEKIFLDIDAWRAVAKFRKWSYIHPTWQYTTALNMDIEVLDPVECAMHNMVMYLFEGKTIEDFLKTLS